MHPVGQTWVNSHDELGRKQSHPMPGLPRHRLPRHRPVADAGHPHDRSGQTLFQGAIVSCYNCHNGPDGDGSAPAAPTVTGVVTNTTNDKSVDMLLPVTGAGAYPRIITQATNGSVGLNTNTHVATYFPNPGFVGTDRFTFAAYDGARNSTLATGTVTVAQGPFSIGAVRPCPADLPCRLAGRLHRRAHGHQQRRARDLRLELRRRLRAQHEPIRRPRLRAARHLQLECDLDRVHRLRHRQRHHRHRQPGAARPLRAPAAR